MLLAFFALALQEASVAPDPVPQVRRAVERSLPFIEQKGLEWIKEKKCSSCHHVTFMLWSHREALSRGFAVDAKKLDEWTKWAVDYSLTTKTKEGERGGGLDTMAQLLADRNAIRRAWDFLVRTQLEDGSWKVRSTKTKPKNDLMSSYWGTAWAAIGLLRTIPQ